MSEPWNGKVVFEGFWWNCWNSNYPHDWYTYLAKLAPRLAAMGFDGIWTPPPCKDTNAEANMGYTPYDYYDIGQKNQKGQMWTRFGTMDAFLRLVAVAHANGLEVYPDMVLDHCAGGDPDPSSPFQTDNQQYTSFQPVGYAGAHTGRWQRNWLDFHFNPVHWHPTVEWTPTASNSFGSDFCYQGRCSDSGNADANCASRQNVRAWFTWFVKQTGVDGFRFDDVAGFPPEVVEDILYNAMGGGLRYFAVGEYVTDSQATVDGWASDTLNRCGTFDYPLRFALAAMVQSGGFYDVGSLPSQQQSNRFKTVPFVSNHDTADDTIGPALDPDNPRTALAYAVAMTVDGSPQLYYEDLFRNVSPWKDGTTAAAIPSRAWLENLVWCHQKLGFKTGDYFVRYQNSQQLLILERGARAIVAINNDGSSWHDGWVSTAFFPNTQLHDYTGTCPGNVWTNADGWFHVNQPPLSYSVWGNEGVTGGFDLAGRRTVQQFEMDDDLGDSTTNFGYGGKAVADGFRVAGAIWPAAGSEVNVVVYADGPEDVSVEMLTSGGAVLEAANGAVPLALSAAIEVEGRYVLRAKVSAAGAAPARLYVKVDYLGPAESALF
ncbi:alpha-amylase domain-containing protein [Granulicella sibirica]|uniref:Cytoplasmic alpha-amylase n=1 Tax=Granulicella sibirica TaxID=2479048 RepID=A0A4Q0T0C4_9BACT|nr:alpha-amylase domain-containing protein [Granulicella sibirica]RXH54826.1 Cytoplasmic alpha-amylase [Granulicella sibirica]